MAIDRSRTIQKGPYGKTVKELKQVAIEHWANWRPKKGQETDRGEAPTGGSTEGG